MSHVFWRQDDAAPMYAILSRRWSDSEILLEDLSSEQSIQFRQEGCLAKVCVLR